MPSISQSIATERNVTLLALLLTIALLLFVLSLFNYQGGALQPADYQQSRILRFNYQITNASNQTVQDASFQSYLPVQQTSSQYAEKIVSSEEYALESDSHKNQIATFKLGTLAPYASKLITVSTKINTALQANRSSLQKKDLYLKAQAYVEVNAPEITQLANTLKAKTTQQTVNNIYDWVAKHIRYSGYISEDRGALYALKEKQGDCTEYMYLVVALNRALNIPARGVAGYVYADSKVAKASDFHNWAEVYFDNKWHIVDAQKKRFNQNIEDYLAMRVMVSGEPGLLGNSHRFSVSKENLKIELL